MFDSWFTGLGIDLSDHHLRLAQVNIFGHIKKLEEIKLPEGIVVDEKVVKPEELKTILSQTLQKKGFGNGPYRTTLLIPESRVFSHSMLLEAKLKREERLALARDFAQKEIPIPFSQATLCFSPGGRENGKIRTKVYVAHKEVLNPLLQAVDHPALRVKAVEANTKSLFRLLMRFDQETKQTNDLIGIVDVGHSWTTMAFYSNTGSSLVSRTIPHPKPKAEKRQVGSYLDPATVDKILGTLKETVVFFQQEERKIGIIVFGGVEAQDPLLKSQAKQLEVPSFLMAERVSLKRIADVHIQVFGSAIGAAFRSMSPRTYSNQHNFLTGFHV